MRTRGREDLGWPRLATLRVVHGPAGPSFAWQLVRNAPCFQPAESEFLGGSVYTIQFDGAGLDNPELQPPWLCLPRHRIEVPYTRQCSLHHPIHFRGHSLRKVLESLIQLHSPHISSLPAGAPGAVLRCLLGFSQWEARLEMRDRKRDKQGCFFPRSLPAGLQLHNNSSSPYGHICQAPSPEVTSFAGICYGRPCLLPLQTYLQAVMASWLLPG